MDLFLGGQGMVGYNWRQKLLVDRAPWLQPIIPDVNTINGPGRPANMKLGSQQFYAVPSETPDNLTPIFSTSFANADAYKFVCSDEEGNLLASADEHTYIRALNRFDQSLYCLGHHQGSVKTARYRPSSGSTIVATGSRDGDICIWDLRTCSPNASLNYPINVLANSHRKIGGGNAVGGSRRSSAVGTTRSGVVALEFLPYQDHLLASIGQPDHSIRIWDIRYKWGINALPSPVESIQSPSSLKSSRERAFTTLCVDPNGTTLYGLNADHSIYGYSTATFSSTSVSSFSTADMQAGSYFIRMSVSPDGQYLACGSMEASAFVFDTRDPGCCYRVGGHYKEVTAVSWRWNCAVAGPLALLSAGEDGIIQCWSEDLEDLRQDLPRPIHVPIKVESKTTETLIRPFCFPAKSSCTEFEEWPCRKKSVEIELGQENIPPRPSVNTNTGLEVATPKSSLAAYFKPVPRSSPFASLAPSLPSSLPSSPRPLHGNSKKRPPSLLDFLTKPSSSGTAGASALPSKLSKHSHPPPSL